MSLFICYLFHPILISWTLGLHKYVSPHYDFWIINPFITFGGFKSYGVTTNRCLGPSYVFFVKYNFGAPLIGLILFGDKLYLCDVNVHFRFITFDLWVTSFGSWVTLFLGSPLEELTQPICLL